LRSHFNNWNSGNSSRGVSPLLGIVLIIGMTIMLSVLVYEFTFGYSKGTIKHVEKEIENAQLVNFDIKEAKIIDYRQLKLLVESKDKKIISIFKGRIYGDRGVQTFTLEGVQPFETRLLSTNYNYLEVGEITKIELIPTTEKAGISNVHPISLETTIKVTSEVSQICQADINLNGIPDCVDDTDNDGCSNDLDYDNNVACSINGCSDSINGCDNICKPITCLEDNVCVNGLCTIPSLQETKCRLLSAYWSKNEIIENNNVDIIVVGENCEGIVKLKFEEKDTFSPDDDVNDTEYDLPTNATFINGTALVTWKAKWFRDKDGAGPNPEITFNASINPSIVSNDSLIIYQESMGGFAAPTIILMKPDDGASLSPSNIEFKCSVSDLSNINNVSLYTNITGSFKKENFVNPHDYVADNSTIALYHFNNDSFYEENRNKFVDFSKYNNNGSCTGSDQSGPCPFLRVGPFSSKAVDFSQAGPPGDYIVVLDDTELDNMENLSISAWVNPRSAGGGGVASIINKPNSYVLRIDAGGSGQANFRVYNYAAQTVQIYSGPGTVLYNTWTHIVAVYNGTHIKMYTNGVESPNKAQISGRIRNSVDNLYIGNSNLFTLTFDGLIDEAILFNKTLSDNEIQDLYQRKNPILTYGLNRTINNVTSGYYIWNCLAYSSESAWAINNYSFLVDAASPTILWEYPTPENNSVVIQNSVYLNTTIIDGSNTSAFFDWNNSLVGYWSMDYYNETGIYDNSTYNNYGRFVGSISMNNITIGKYGKGMVFNGLSNDFIRIPSSDSLGNMDKLSISAWVYPYTLGQTTQGRIVFKAGTYLLSLTPNSNIDFTIFNYTTIASMTTTANSIQLNKWNHVVGVYNGTEMNVYINGVKDNNYNRINGSISINSHDLILGNFVEGGTAFDGIIDEVKIFNRALSPEEINASFNNGIYRLYHNFTNLLRKEYNYSAYAIDLAGNLNISKRVVEIVRPVQVSLSMPQNNAILVQQSVPLLMQCNISDYEYLDNVSLYTNISGTWNITKSVVINELEMKNGAQFLLHFNNNNISDEGESPLFESGTDYVGGKYKQAIRVNGSDSLYYNSSNNFNIGYGTIEFWLKPEWFGNDPTGYVFFFSRAEINGDHIKIGKVTTTWPYIYATFNSSAYEANSFSYGLGPESVGNWAPGQWHHIAVTYNLTNHSVYLYLDGNERGYANDTTCGPPTCTWNFIPTNTGSNFSIGHNYFFSPQYANASFDEFVIYDRVLNLSEIREDMNRTDPTRSFNATFRIANIQTDGPYGWNCLAYNIYNTSGWAPENWTFTYTATPYVELLYPVNNSNLNEGYINFSCVAQDYDRIVNVSLEVYNKNTNTRINVSKVVGEIGDFDTGLALLYHFNNDSGYIESETRVFDFSGNNNYGYIYGPRYNESGILSKGLKFDGINDYISIRNSQSIKNINSSGSLAAWVTLDSENCLDQLSGICAIFDVGGTGNNGLIMMINSANRPFIQYGTGSGVTDAIADPIIKGNWYHIVGTWDSNGGKIYVNGLLQGTTNIAPLYSISQTITYIGSDGGANRFFNGTIDEIAFFNKALDPSEIYDYYNTTKNRYNANFILNLDGGNYEWNCRAYDSDNYMGNSAFNHTLKINKRPNITSIYMGNDGNMYNCNEGCYVTPFRHSNVSNLSIRVSIEDTDCSLITHKVFMHLCLINSTLDISTNSTLDSENCNEITSNYTYQLNNLSIDIGSSSYDIPYLCNFSTASEIGPEGQNERGTPAFYIPPGNYKIFVNTTEIGTSLNVSLSNDYSWVYRTLVDTGFINNLGSEISTLQIGDGDIQLGEYNPGVNEYRLQNWGNLILNVNWNASNPMHSVNQQVWNINEPPDGFILDDDINVAYPDVGLMALNITNISESFVFANGLRRCISFNCNDLINGIYPLNESLSTRWHIKPPFGLSAGQYDNEIIYILSPWKGPVENLSHL